MARRRIIKSRFINALTELRGHLVKCTTCRVVMKSAGLGNLCREGRMLVFECALLSTKLAALHRRAYDNPQDMIYACPDRTRHGMDYSSTAEPHKVNSVQGWLF